MENRQLEVIVGLLSGMQLALVHVCKTLESKGLTTSNELIQSFQATAAAIPMDAANRPLMQMVLNQIASGIQASSQQDTGEPYRNALH